MSSRTAAASRAIREAWENEKRLVLEGKGSRDWAEEHQKQIKEKGKAYDSDGRAFEGQHMKSVSVYPEYQGDARNIQLLSHAEHLAAHGGNWQNPTNGYYDPVTKTMSDFGDGPPKPCAEVPLTNPLYPDPLEAAKTGSSAAKSESVNALSETATVPKSIARNLSQTLQRGAHHLWRATVKVAKNPLTWAAAVSAVIAVAEPAANQSRSENRNSNNVYSAQSAVMEDPGSEAGAEREVRTSPEEHDVSGYVRKDGTSVRPYRRGGNFQVK